MNRHQQPQDSSQTDSAPSSTCSCRPRLRIILLCVVGLHGLGVLAEPLRFCSRSENGQAPEFAWLASIYRPYSQWLYLDHGYFFFAPNPGPGHLVEYELVTTPSERANETLFFPDRKRYWPRLLYHRYFMLSEFYHSRYAPAQVTEELRRDPEFMARWSMDLHFYRQLQASLKKSLSFAAGNSVSGLKRWERGLPTPDQVILDRLPLTDPRFLVVLPESMLESLPVPKPSDGSSPEDVLGIKAGNKSL